MNNDIFLVSNIDSRGAAVMEAKNQILFYSNTQHEMLRVTPEGFYVRGVKVPQDENEAQSVYKTFHQWLTWATLNRSF